MRSLTIVYSNRGTALRSDGSRYVALLRRAESHLGAFVFIKLDQGDAFLAFSRFGDKADGHLTVVLDALTVVRSLFSRDQNIVTCCIGREFIFLRRSVIAEEYADAVRGKRIFSIAVTSRQLLFDFGSDQIAARDVNELMIYGVLHERAALVAHYRHIIVSIKCSPAYGFGVASNCHDQRQLITVFKGISSYFGNPRGDRNRLQILVVIRGSFADDSDRFGDRVLGYLLGCRDLYQGRSVCAEQNSIRGEVCNSERIAVSRLINYENILKRTMPIE